MTTEKIHALEIILSDLLEGYPDFIKIYKEYGNELNTKGSVFVKGTLFIKKDVIADVCRRECHQVKTVSVELVDHCITNSVMSMQAKLNELKMLNKASSEIMGIMK